VLLFGELCTQRNHFGLQFELPRRRLGVGKDDRCIVKQMPLPVVKNTRLQLIPVAQITDGNPIQMMLPEQLRLLRWSPILSRTLASIFAYRTLLTVSLTQECPWWDSAGAKQYCRPIDHIDVRCDMDKVFEAHIDKGIATAVLGRL
jgi:hypothetical protein